MNLKERYPELFWPVTKHRTDELYPGMLTNSYNSHKIVVKTLQGLKELSSCSEIYHLVPNEDIILPIWDLLSPYYDIQLKPQVYQDAVFYMDIIFTQKTGNLGTVNSPDLIHPKLTLSNSYNGRLKLGATMSAERLVCSNGLTVPETLGEDRFMHTPSIGEVLSNEVILNMVSSFVEEFADFLEPFEDLRASPVRNLQFRIEEVVEATKFPVRQIEEVINRIELERANYNYPTTDWLVYNGFNFQLNHNPEIEMSPQKKLALDRAIQTYLREN